MRTALAFRTDGQPLLVSGSSRGSLHVWHLERRVRLTSMPAAHHNGAIASLHFVRGQPHLLSLGASDNALKEWTFDRPDGGGRLLRSRSGHSAPPRSCVSTPTPCRWRPRRPGYHPLEARIAPCQSSIWSAQQDCELSQRRGKQAPCTWQLACRRRLPSSTSSPRKFASATVERPRPTRDARIHVGHHDARARAAYAADAAELCGDGSGDSVRPRLSRRRERPRRQVQPADTRALGDFVSDRTRSGAGCAQRR